MKAIADKILEKQAKTNRIMFVAFLVTGLFLFIVSGKNFWIDKQQALFGKTEPNDSSVGLLPDDALSLNTFESIRLDVNQRDMAGLAELQSHVN